MRLSATVTRMSWILPTPLWLLAGVAALVPLTYVLRRPVSGLRLMAETFAVTLAVIAAFWLGWVALWLLEHRWRAHRRTIVDNPREPDVPVSI